MSTMRASVTELARLLSDAVAPDAVGVHDGDVAPSDPVVLRVVAIDRIGRSRRDGPVLDLELTAAIECTGPRSLEHIEQMLGALESSPLYSVGSFDARRAPALGFEVRVPLAIRIPEPEASLVRTPLEVTTVVGRLLSGVLVGADGFGIEGARIRAGSSTPASSDPRGRFELLSTSDPQQELTVELRGVTRRFTAEADPLPLLIRWD